MSTLCAECGHEILYFGEGDPPERCEDCLPQSGAGSRLLDRFSINLREVRARARIEREELARRTGLSVGELAQLERGTGAEPRVTRALRLADSLGASIDSLTERIYWNPGEMAPTPGERRPPSQRLRGFFSVLPANVPVFESAPPREPVAGREEAAAIFGQNLREARERRHLTQLALARAAGLSKAGLSLIERGVHETTTETTLALARALEVRPELLLGGIAWEPPGALCPAAGRARQHPARSLDLPIKRLWREGKTAAEIASVLDTSAGTVSATVHRLRERGEHLRYRRPPTRPIHERARQRRGPSSAVSRREEERPAEEVDEAAGAALSDEGVAAQIGANVARCRRERELTLRELGEATGQDRSYLQHIEKGLHIPKLALLVKLAASLNVRCGLVTGGVAWDPDSGAFRLKHEGREAASAPKLLGEAVRRARQRLDLSQQALADRASISRGDVVDFERGKRAFRIFTLIRLAAALGVDYGDLLSPVVDWYVRPLPAPEYAPGDPPPTKAERDALLMRLWRDCRPEREIAEALDLAATAVGPYVRELRDGGEDLPYRRLPRSAAERAARRRRRARSSAH
jgi:transcriptional regulator with XRE-family HTH domain